MKKLIFIFAVLLFIANTPYPVSSGTYTDYTYKTDYSPPLKPVPQNLNCSFFYRDGNTCEILDMIPDESKDNVLLGIIKKIYPDENQDWVRFWNSRLQIDRYYEDAKIEGLNISDGAYHSNHSMQNTWVRLLNVYPSVYSQQGGFYYVSNQALILGASNVDFVVPNPQGDDWCKQEYDIGGYTVEKKTIVGDYQNEGQIISFTQALEQGEQKNITYSLKVNSTYSQKLWKWQNTTECVGAECTITQRCELNITNQSNDEAVLNISLPIRRFPDAFSYSNQVAIPSSGFAQGVMDLRLPKDFLFYQFTIKGHAFRLRKNDIQIVKRGEIYPVLQLELIPTPAKDGTLHVTSLVEEEIGDIYRAELRYKFYIENPNVSESDCHFYMMTPFSVEEVEDACTTARSNAQIDVRVKQLQNSQAQIIANVTDQLSNPIEGIEVEFSGHQTPTTRKTDSQGITTATIVQKESAQTIVAKIVGSQQYATAQKAVFVPGRGASPEEGSQTLALLTNLLPIFLILIIVISLVTILTRKRSKTWALAPFLLLLFAIPVFAQGQTIEDLDVAATLEACRNYDFDNAVRHLGECSESYRIVTEFSAMRRTATILIGNIAPLVVANPDIAPYKVAYSNMVLIALSLFRVAWAFNSLYLILNIFNPTKRSQALRQYVWLIVFVIFTYASFSILQDAISAVNSVSVWIAGTDASDTLSQATLSTQFIVENYEMLKLVLPFLNLSYLILLARYITVIGMILFFPFTLLLFFTRATRGFGKAALTVTFAALGLGVLNAILLLIYNILVQTQDPALTGSFASTFFSASFIVFFGFVNLIVLAVSFLSGIVFIGGGRN